MKRATSVAALLLLALTTSVMAHTLIFQGTVAAVEATRIQLKTGEEKKGKAPAWLEITPSHGGRPERPMDNAAS